MKLIEDEETPIAYIENLEREVTRLNKEILALQAHINVLREALEEISSYQVDEVVDAVCDEALASTPAQSLQAHDNEVIERCAKVCESIKEMDYCVDVREGADAIRALKGK